MAQDRHITWENFRTSYISPGDPAVHLIPGQPSCELFVDSGGGRIGLWAKIPCGNSEIPNNLNHLKVRRVSRHSTEHLEISTSLSEFFEPCYAVLVSIADRLQLEKLDAVAAVKDAIADFKALLQSRTVLNDDAIAGLWGELWLLARLLKVKGSSALDSWVGPLGEAHDFRFGNYEIEVKTVRSAERSHIINGLKQLQPSPGKTLYLLSLQIARAGAGGASLNDCAESIIQHTNEPALREKIQNTLRGLGFRREDAEAYREPFQLRSKPLLIQIDQTVPQISPAVLASAWGTSAARINDVHYRLSVDGLDHEDGSPEFAAVIP